MPLTSIKLVPGINSVKTETLLELGWTAGSNIRFFQGLPQKDAGFVNLLTTPDTGIVRALLAWEALDKTNWLAVASEPFPIADKLYVWDGVTTTDITPVVIGASGVATMANWGEFLMYSDGLGINVWMPPPAPPGPAVPIVTAPARVGFIFIATQEQMLVAAGATDAGTGNFDPMLVRWSDISDYTQWTPAVSNQAGSFRLAFGSRINAALPVYGQNYVWTDTCVYSMQYIQFPLVWGFQPLGINVGAVGPHSIGILGGVPFWCGQNQFFTMAGGAPVQIECPVWDQVFVNFDKARMNETVCQTDTFYGEVGWSVPQTDPDSPGLSTKWITARLNVATGAWTCSDYRHDTAWIDQNVFGPPIGGLEGGFVDQHDTGYDARGAAAAWSLMSGIMMIAEGSDVTFIRDLIPDFKTDGTDATVYVEASLYDYPDKPPRVKGPFTMTSSTQLVHPRGRGKGLQLRFYGNDLGSFVRFGNIRVRAQPDGRR